MGKTIKKLQNALIVILAFMNLSSCGQQEHSTFQKYKSHVLVSKKEYTNDSIYIYYVLKSMLAKNITPFTPSSYYDNRTVVYLDSILYSPDRFRLVIFAITQVEKKVKLANKSRYDYNGNYLFCERTETDSTIKVFNYAPFNLANYDSDSDLKFALRDLVFRRRSGDHWSDSQPSYNMDDKRFWYSDEFNSISSSTTYTWLK